MRANEVSIVVCRNCGHDHPLGLCTAEVLIANVMCGCTQWQPVLKPFAITKPTLPKHEREHWLWKVVAWAALIALFVWITYGGGQ